METLKTWVVNDTCLSCNHTTQQVIQEGPVQTLYCANCGKKYQDHCKWIRDRKLEDHTVEYINSILKQK